MSGHSKWSTIKRKKGAIDAKRSKIFSKIIKEITIAIKEGGNNDPDFNPRLRLAIANAKGVNMPKDNIERAIKKADTDNASFQEVTFEGKGPGSIFYFVECMTDNQQRTVSNVRSYFTKKGGELLTNGSLNHTFSQKGMFQVPLGNLSEDDFMMEVIDAGAEDIELDEGYFHITTGREDFGKMMKKLEEMNVEPESAKLERIPATTVSLDNESAKKALDLVELLEDDDDVQNVYHNLEMTEDLLDAM